MDSSALQHWYRRNRARSRELFDLVTDEAYYSRPIALRHPIVFYEGHLPAFSFNTLVKKALGLPSISVDLERLFARGIDPHESAGGGDRCVRDATDGWPQRDVVLAFAEKADRQVLDALADVDFDRPGSQRLKLVEAAFCILEHEAMHQETLLYMWQRLPLAQKNRPAQYRPRTDGASPGVEWMTVPEGQVTLGAERATIPFGWDNEFPALSTPVPAFAIERHNVTNARFLEFVNAGGYADGRWWLPEDWQWVRKERVEHPLFWEQEGGRWHWRGMFDVMPLPMSWPVYVSQAEAAAFTRWSGTRLPTEAEFQRAAYGSPDGERQYPWGSTPPSPLTGAYDFASWDPEPSGSHPKGASAWGIEDLVGNGWEWTSTRFGPFPGFRPSDSYPEYSTDFFDGEHFVMKGASIATAKELIRPSFRNWFRARYPYVFSKFRCVKSV